jgi:Na+-transporting methylmalonyl-CoA/oxaloacetate decarboxylase gamma subunit
MDTAGQSMDSLLDTMANVVGILVVLVAVMQLAVGDAVDRILEEGVREPATLPEVEAAESQREELAKVIVQVREELESLPPAAARPGMLREEVQPLIDALSALAGPDRLLPMELAELRQKVEQKSDSVARRKEELHRQRARLAQLEALLAASPPEQRPKVARLPDPRPPPKGAGEVVFFCRYGRVLPVDPEELLARLHVGIEDALGETRPLVDDDRPWLENLFRKELFGSQNFYWRFRETGHRGLFADMVWRDREAGEHTGDLRLEGNLLERAVGEQDSKKTYVRFWVWADSFEVYLEARYLAEAAGFDVAWTAVPTGEEVGVDLLSRSRTRVMID